MHNIITLNVLCVRRGLRGRRGNRRRCRWRRRQTCWQWAQQLELCSSIVQQREHCIAPWWVWEIILCKELLLCDLLHDEKFYVFLFLCIFVFCQSYIFFFLSISITFTFFKYNRNSCLQLLTVQLCVPGWSPQWRSELCPVAPWRKLIIQWFRWHKHCRVGLADWQDQKVSDYFLFGIVCLNQE